MRMNMLREFLEENLPAAPLPPDYDASAFMAAVGSFNMGDEEIVEEFFLSTTADLDTLVQTIDGFYRDRGFSVTPFGASSPPMEAATKALLVEKENIHWHVDYDPLGANCLWVTVRTVPPFIADIYREIGEKEGGIMPPARFGLRPERDFFIPKSAIAILLYTSFKPYSHQNHL